jgi:hypothetical protein
MQNAGVVGAPTIWHPSYVVAVSAKRSLQQFDRLTIGLFGFQQGQSMGE